MDSWDSFTQLKGTTLPTHWTQEILNKKSIIRSMILKDWDKETRRTCFSGIRRFEEGFRDLMFSKGSPMNKFFPRLVKAVNTQVGMLERRNAKVKLTTTIKADGLTYLEVEKEKQNMNLNVLQNRWWNRSKYFTFGKTKDPVKELYDVSSKALRTPTDGRSAHLTSSSICIPTNLSLRKERQTQSHKTWKAKSTNKTDCISKNKNTNKISTSCTITNSTLHTTSSHSHVRNFKPQFTTLFSPMSSTNINSFIKSSTLTPSTSNSRSISKEEILKWSSKMRVSIGRKVNKINSRQGKWNKKLFDLIDRASYRKTEKKFGDTLIADSLDLKVKRKKRNQAQEIYVQAVKIRDDYSGMNTGTAGLLKCSDTFMKLTDSEALHIADKLLEIYYHKTEDANIAQTGQMPESIKKRKYEAMRTMRRRVKWNQEKMIQMGLEWERVKRKMNV